MRWWLTDLNLCVGHVGVSQRSWDKVLLLYVSPLAISSLFNVNLAVRVWQAICQASMP